jgi:cell division septation protein DedD
MEDMTNAEETYEDDYNEYEEFDDEDERGLSGFAVLLIGLVMIGAFISVVWIAYQQGMRRNPDGGAESTPYVAADPEPIKIESANEGAPAENREVYDVFDGGKNEPAKVLAEGSEEPIDRTAEESAETAPAAAETSVPQVASLQEQADKVEAAPAPQTPAPQTPAPQTPASPAPARAPAPSSDIERIDKGAEGVYHRLRVGPFSSSDAARQYCVGLKERGQDCFAASL